MLGSDAASLSVWGQVSVSEGLGRTGLGKALPYLVFSPRAAGYCAVLSARLFPRSRPPRSSAGNNGRTVAVVEDPHQPESRPLRVDDGHQLNELGNVKFPLLQRRAIGRT